LVCLHAETGGQLWEFRYDTTYEDLYRYNGGPRCSPVIDGHRVYIYGVEGLLHCLDVTDGRLLWACDTAKQFGVIQNFFGVGSTPLIEGDLLIAVVGGSPASDQSIPPGQLDRVSGNGSGIVAFDKRTGAVRYRITDELAGYASPIAATIQGRRWCFAFCRGGLVGFDPQRGTVDFQYPWRSSKLESVNASTPVVVASQIFLSETYGPGSVLLQIDPSSTPSVRAVWQDESRQRRKAFQAHWATPIYHGGYLYGCSGRNSPDAELRCIDWKTGNVQWSESDGVHLSLLYVDGHFVALEEYGRLRLLRANPQQYEVVSELELGQWGPSVPPGQPGSLGLLQYPCWAAPILAHGLLYLRGDDRLVCLELIPR
jgi:outer membrane protein assembly factor BamB